MLNVKTTFADGKIGVNSTDLHRFEGFRADGDEDAVEVVAVTFVDGLNVDRFTAMTGGNEHLLSAII